MRPKRYPYSRKQWETETTVLYSGEKKEYCRFNIKVNRITGKART